MLKNKIMKQRKVVFSDDENLMKVFFTDNDGMNHVFIFDDLNTPANGTYFYFKKRLVLFLPNTIAFATFNLTEEIPEFLCLPSKK